MASYDVIQVSGHEVYDVHDDFGGSLENVLFDQTNGWAHVTAMGSRDFVIRNVGFMGKVSISNDRQQMKIGSAGTGVVENVYMGDGCTAGGSMNGILVDGDHSGLLKIRNLHVAEYSDNGVYASNSGEWAGGDTHIEKCYAHHNNITQYRLGTNNSYVRDSVAFVTDPGRAPAAETGHNPRIMRMHYVNGNEVRNCQFFQAASTWMVQPKDGGSGDVYDSTLEGGVIGDSIGLHNVSMSGADLTPPDGTPMTAKQAASGEGGSFSPDPISVTGKTSLSVNDAQMNPGTLVRTVHSGYTGTGFIDLEPRDGAYARWLLDVQSPGEYVLSVRYSNGDTDRNAQLDIGDDSQQVTFSGTGGWNTWDTLESRVTLPAGETEFGFRTTGDDAGQIDTVSLDPVTQEPEEPETGPDPVQAGTGAILALGVAGAAYRKYREGR